ncbi:hypothetical protein B0H16DRAFT_1718734 [Mycena metata]|uniref:CFEM domain-containing protein n=1 Tax=Mycena metata TaxID=1033252 RepID=A0AAD7NJG1_9AGAR|nr:hypothetical protein B0H16DRAFT_1718734 [Mycena metata]
MFKTLGVTLLFAASVAAQATSLPECAQGCANEAATKAQCTLSDIICLCKTNFASSVLQCADSTSCSLADQTEVSTILEGMCNAVSVSASGSSSATSAAPSSSGSISAPIVPPLSPPISISTSVITSTITSVSPPQTTTITSLIPVTPSNTGSTLVPPPISPSFPSTTSGSVSASVTAPGSSSTPSTTPSAAQAMNARAAGAAGAVIGLSICAALLL